MGASLASQAPDSRQSGAESYFRSLHGAFLKAAEAAGGLVEHDLKIGPTRVRLRFAGNALVPLMLPALAHLQTPESAPPTLTLCVWDSSSTGVEVPAFPWRPRDLRQRGEVAGYHGGPFRTVFHGNLIEPNLGFNALSMYSEDSRTGIFWLQSADRLPWFESAAPLRTLFKWGLEGPTRRLVHAGVVSGPDGGVLIGGKSGSGKSTATLACVEAGFKFLGDDYVLFELGATPKAHSLFCVAKLLPESLGLFESPERLGHGVKPDDQEKFDIDLNRSCPDLVERTTTIKALVLPRLADGGGITIRPASRVEALLALAPSTIYQLPSNEGDPLGTMSELVRRVPAYVLELGGPPAGVPEAIASVLRSETR